MLSTCTTYNPNLTLAMTGLLDAAREVKDTGTFGYLDRVVATGALNAFMQA